MSATLLKGAPVAGAIKEKIRQDTTLLAQRGIKPTLAIVRVGEREDDLSYEKSILKICADVGVEAQAAALDIDIGQNGLSAEIERLNGDDSVHGILVFMPLPKGYDGEAVRKIISPEKDIDGMSEVSMSSVYSGNDNGFAPCTAQAVMEILKYYEISLSGKKACVLGRSLVIGRPVSMLLLSKNATVTMCHSKTENIESIAKACDVLIAATGKAQGIGPEYFSPGQTVIDVGIHFGADGKMCGDVDFEAAKKIVSAITPVPGGVGSVTTAVLVGNVVKSALRKY